jgi:hypothetical protein
MTARRIAGSGLLPRFCALALFFAFLWGCSVARNLISSVPRQQAMTHSMHTYTLGREPDQDREQAFQALLETAHAAALVKRGASPDTGLSYSLSPKGAVYPFSEVEIACLVQKADAGQGKALCKEFFKAVDEGFRKIIEPR